MDKQDCIFDGGPMSSTLIFGGQALRRRQKWVRLGKAILVLLIAAAIFFLGGAVL